MKLSAPNRLLIICSFFFLPIPAEGQCKCTCQPSPPGGVTSCPEGQIAVCGAASNSVCEGTCIEVKLRGNPPDANFSVYAAAVLSVVLNKKILQGDLEGQEKEALTAIQKLLISSEKNKLVNINFAGIQRAVVVGLPPRGEDQLRFALEQLKTLSPVERIKGEYSGSVEYKKSPAEGIFSSDLLPFVLRLRVLGDTVTGEVEYGSGFPPRPIYDVTLRGDKITFSFESRGQVVTMIGHIKDGRFTGDAKVLSPERKGHWSAKRSQ
jgi:hypothetical protein